MIYNDPVYIDATRVSSSDVAEPLSGELDTVAFTLYRELVVWGASPAAQSRATCDVLCAAGASEPTGSRPPCQRAGEQPAAE